MDRKEIERFGQLWQEVVEKKLDPVNHKALKGKHADRMDKDIDNDGDVDSSDEYLHKRRKAVSKSMAKEGNDLDAENALKAREHDCAKHVAHESWGKGECIPGEHTLVEQEDGTAIVTHYDVMFEHGIEHDVPVEDLQIVVSEKHLHAAKKHAKMHKEEKCPKCEGKGCEHCDYKGTHEAYEGMCGKMNASYSKKKVKEEVEVVSEGTIAQEEELVQQTYNHFVHGTRAALQQMWEKASQGSAGKHKDEYMQNQPQSAKDFAAQHDADNPKTVKDDEEGHQDALKVAKAGKQSPTRGGEKRMGDTKIVNPVKGSVQ